MAFSDDLSRYGGGSGMNITMAPSQSLSGVLDELQPFYDRARKNKETDFENRQRFMEGAPIRQMNAERAMNPFGHSANEPVTSVPTGGFSDPNINTRMGPETPVQNAIEPLSKAQIAQQELQSAELKQKTAAENERAAQAQREFGLESLKNSQIFQTKVADLQRKHDEANQKLDVANQKLAQNANDSKSRDDYHNAQLRAINAKHDLDMAHKQNELDEFKRLHDAQIKELEARAKASTGSTTTTTLQGDPNAPTGRTTVTKRGEGAKIEYPKTGQVRVIGPDGKTHIGDAKDLEEALKIPGYKFSDDQSGLDQK